MTLDTRVAVVLFCLAMATVPASSPMFVAHFRHSRVTARPPVKVPSVAVLFVAETVKVALFSALAAWAGARGASAAGIDAPVTRALLAGDGAGALRALAMAVPVALGAGLGVVGLERAVVRGIALPAPARAPMSSFARATGVFYGAIAIELWFRWGVLASVARGLRAAALPAIAAVAVATAVSALAQGVFAIPSTIAACDGAPRRRSVLRALLVTGAPTVLLAGAIVAGGFEAGVLGASVGYLSRWFLRAHTPATS